MVILTPNLESSSFALHTHIRKVYYIGAIKSRCFLFHSRYSINETGGKKLE